MTTLITVCFFGMIIGAYGVLNNIYQNPVLILTPERIFMGLKTLFRSPIITNFGIPKEDMKLIIVKDSKLHRFILYLEGRQLLQLGIYYDLDEAEVQRGYIKKILSSYYASTFISSPIYHEI